MHLNKTELREKLLNFKKFLRHKCHIKNYESDGIPAEEILLWNSGQDYFIGIIIAKIKLYYFGMTGDNAQPRETKEDMMEYFETDSLEWYRLRYSKKYVIALIKEYILLD